MVPTVEPELDAETLAEIEDALALPIGHVASVREDGRILVALNSDGVDLLRLGFLDLADPRGGPRR